MVYVIDSYTCTTEDVEAGTYAYARLEGSLQLPLTKYSVQVRYNGDIYDLSNAWAEWVYSNDNTYITAEIHHNSNMRFDDGDEIELIQQQESTTTVVTFNANGGIGGPSSETYTYRLVGDEYYVGDNLPTKANNTFLGWYDDQTGGEEVWDQHGFFNGGSYGEATGDPSHDVWLYTGSTLTVYAHWQADSTTSATLTFNNSGLAGSTVPADRTITYSEEVILVDGTPPTGYTFLGWATTEAKAKSGTVDVSKNYKSADTSPTSATLYAVWRSTLTYKHNNGGSNITDYMYYSPQNIAVSGPQSTGYDFVSWNTSPGGMGTDYAPGSSVKPINTWKPNYILYGKWQPKNYTLTLNTYDDQSSIQQLTVTYWASTNYTVSVPEKTNFKFLGYYDDNEVQIYDENGQAVLGTDYWKFQQQWHWAYDGDVILYAHWVDNRKIWIYDQYKTKIKYTKSPSKLEWEDIDLPGTIIY